MHQDTDAMWQSRYINAAMKQAMQLNVAHVVTINIHQQ